MLWLALVTYEKKQFLKLGWDEVVARILHVGISQSLRHRQRSGPLRVRLTEGGRGAQRKADVALEAVGAAGDLEVSGQVGGRFRFGTLPERWSVRGVRSLVVGPVLGPGPAGNQ